MCWKISSPKVDTSVPAYQTTPSTTAKEPDAPVFGTDADAKKTTGKRKLTIQSTTTKSNPLNI